MRGHGSETEGLRPIPPLPLYPMPAVDGLMQEAPNTTERAFTVLLRTKETPHVEEVAILSGTFGPTPDHPETQRTIQRLLHTADRSGYEVISMMVNVNDADEPVQGVEA